jgi:hypothetical protein
VERLVGLYGVDVEMLDFGKPFIADSVLGT